MVKKIRVFEELPETEEVSSEVSTQDVNKEFKELMEIAKSVDWKLWEMLQTLQRVESKLPDVSQFWEMFELMQTFVEQSETNKKTKS